MTEKFYGEFVWRLNTSTSGGSLGQHHGSQAVGQPSGQEQRQWALWFGLFGGVAAWTLHLAIAYPLVYNGCALGLDQLSTWLLILTAVLGAVALLATLAAFFTWRGATGAQASPPVRLLPPPAACSARAAS